VHAIAVDIAAAEASLPEGALNPELRPGVRLELGRNSYFEHTWLPPDPPPGHGEHRYVFQVFALAGGAAFSKAPGRSEFIKGVLERAIGVGCLIGTYDRGLRTRSEIAEEKPSSLSPA
jgi:hypothetical protein